MRVKVEEIREKGLDLEEALPAAMVNEALASVEGFKLRRAGKLKARFERVGTEVLVKGSLDLELEAPCKRCLDAVQFEVPVAFELALIPQSKFEAPPDEEGEDDGNGARAGTFAFESADQEPFDGKSIDMGPIAREQLLLGLPPSVLCKDDCKGLCTVCGQDLNEKECGCDRKPVDVRLLKLKDIKLKS